MSDAAYTRHDRPHAHDTIRRVRAYLMSRPSESWMFFFVGVVVGAILG